MTKRWILEIASLKIGTLRNFKIARELKKWSRWNGTHPTPTTGSISLLVVSYRIFEALTLNAINLCLHQDQSFNQEVTVGRFVVYMLSNNVSGTL